jgi:hypothetical protein
MPAVANKVAIDMDGFPSHCPTNKTPGQIILVRTTIWRQCADYENLDDIILQIPPSATKGDSPFQFSDGVTFIPIIGGGSQAAVANLYGSRPVEMTVTIQDQAFSQQVHELMFGTQYTPDPDLPGWGTMNIGDRTGSRVPRYIVVNEYFDGGVLIAKEIAKDAEIMAGATAPFSASTPFSQELKIMAMPDDSIEQIRVVRKFKN